MGNLGSAVLSAAAGQPKLGLPSESLMQAYVNMQAPTGRESRVSGDVTVSCDLV